MSSTSTPTDQFSHLSLDPQMSSSGEPVKARAVEVRDVLSSFDRDAFPSEYRNDIFSNIDRPASLRPRHNTEWTIQQDLVATLLQWGSYDEDAWAAILRLQPLATRTRCFHEKLNRRFDQIFDDYDVLEGTLSSSQEAHEAVRQLAKRFAAVVVAVRDDRDHRSEGHSRTAEYTIGALLGACNRYEDLMLAELVSPTSQRSGSSSGPPPRSDISLFQVVVRDSDTSRTGGLLILDLLESYPSNIIGELRAQLDGLLDHLNSHGAPSAFIERAAQLLQIARENEPLSPEDEEADEDATRSARTASSRGSARGGARGKGTATTTRAGSKRAAASEGPSRQGRKKTAK